MSPHPDAPKGRIALVTGGSGFVGGHLIARLIEAGWQVRGTARSLASRAAVQRLGAEPRDGDLADPVALERAMAGVDTVFHGAAHFRLWGAPRIFHAMNVEGTRNVLDAAAGAGIRRLVHVSAAAVVMGDPEPQLQVTEDLALRRMAFAPYAASKAEAEAIVLAASGRSAGFSTIAIRPPFIWGPGMPALDQIEKTVAAGQFRWVAGGGQQLSTCHVQNLCHALILAADHGRDGAAYFVSDAVDTTLKAFLTQLLASRGVTPPDRSVPFGMAWAMAGALGLVWRLAGLGGEPPMTRQMLRLIGQDFTLNIARARAELGYSPVLTPEEGFLGLASARGPAAERPSDRRGGVVDRGLPA